MKRFFILSTLTLLLGFGGGFFMGFADMKTLDQIGLGAPVVSFLVEDSDLLTDELIEMFSAQSGVRIKLSKAANYSDFKNFSTTADIILARMCWLERLNIADKGQQLKSQAWVEKNISPDFLSFNHREIKYIPLFWNVGDLLHSNLIEAGKLIKFEKPTGLYLIGLFAKRKKKVSQLLEVMVRKPQMQSWIETIPWASTYMSLDESLLEKHHKAAFIRELPFQKINLVESSQPDCDRVLVDHQAR